MINLTLVRHSIAEEKEIGKEDLFRNLTQKGIERIKEVTAKIPIKMVENAIFITSPANRCTQTAELFAQHFKIPINQIKKEAFLYSNFTEQSFFYFLKEYYRNEKNIWIVGHNPMLSDLAMQLSNKKISFLSKCAVVSFKSNANDWLEVNFKNTKVELFVNPKEN